MNLSVLFMLSSFGEVVFNVCVRVRRPDSILHQLFIVRFLGSMEVRTAESADVISETMRQILAARAIHNIFRMTESHLLVTCDCLKYEPPCVCVWRGEIVLLLTLTWTLAAISEALNWYWLVILF